MRAVVYWHMMVKRMYTMLLNAAKVQGKWLAWEKKLLICSISSKFLPLNRLRNVIFPFKSFKNPKSNLKIIRIFLKVLTFVKKCVWRKSCIFVSKLFYRGYNQVFFFQTKFVTLAVFDQQEQKYGFRVCGFLSLSRHWE